MASGNMASGVMANAFQNTEGSKVDLSGEVGTAKYCPNCGIKATGKFCTNCGMKLVNEETNE